MLSQARFVSGREVEVVSAMGGEMASTAASASAVSWPWVPGQMVTLNALACVKHISHDGDLGVALQCYRLIDANCVVASI